MGVFSFLRRKEKPTEQGKAFPQPQMICCLKCGKSLNEDMLFCPYCGTERSKNKKSQGRDLKWIVDNLKILEESAARYTYIENSTHIDCWPVNHCRTITCSNCGCKEQFFYSSMAVDSLDEHEEKCESLSKLGVDAKLVYLCRQCAKTAPINNGQVMVSFFSEGMTHPVISYPWFFMSHGFLGTLKYDLAIHFLAGANTVDALTEACGKSLPAEDVISMVKEVVLTGSRATPRSVAKPIFSQNPDK